MSRQATFLNTIHLRDFVDSVTDDPGRKNAPNYMEIQTEVNIFDEDGFYSSRIDISPIRTHIHAYLTREERELYTPNTFFYTDGRFSAAQSAAGMLEISWCPIVTVIGSVPSPTDNTSDPSEPCRFTIEISVYDASKASPVLFSVTYFFENTKRITAKVAGRTTDTN
ncbi:hypothetical protein EDB80DRAFT_812219 [Ilyonectria destructans]|nr:hypothetical protein EDB80DRAFT_812219 [Ilyonectria destructans]